MKSRILICGSVVSRGQVLAGSNHVGRIDHVRSGDQAGADPERVQHVSKHCRHIYCEMSPGDALFFHCNTLHCSSPNLSDHRRMAYIMSFNRADNNPVYTHSYEHHYTPLDKVNTQPHSGGGTCYM